MLCVSSALKPLCQGKQGNSDIKIHTSCFFKKALVSFGSLTFHRRFKAAVVPSIRAEKAPFPPAPAPRGCRANGKLHSAKQEPSHAAPSYADFPAFLLHTNKPRGQRGLLQFKKELLQFSPSLLRWDLSQSGTIPRASLQELLPPAAAPRPAAPRCRPGRGACCVHPHPLAEACKHIHTAFLKQLRSLRFCHLLAVQNYSLNWVNIEKRPRSPPNGGEFGISELRSLICFLLYPGALRNLKILSKLHQQKNQIHICPRS